MTFSSDGRFFACTSFESEVYLWEASPTGYALFERLRPGIQFSNPLFSPNGGSIITFRHHTIQSWHTKYSTTTPSNGSTQPPQQNKDFILEFFPNRPLAIVARYKDKSVTVLDLNSGVLRLTIDTSLEVCGLRAIEGAIVVIGYHKAITWDLPGGDFPPDARMNVEDSTRTINFGAVNDHPAYAASISLDFRHIAFIKYLPESWPSQFLDIYCTFTGQNLQVEAPDTSAMWFAPGGQDIWCIANNKPIAFKITQDAVSPTEIADDMEDGPRGCPWGSSRGYKVADDGWILGQGGERLLILPPIWRSRSKENRVWNGKFLALVHSTLPEPVILEMEP